MQDDLDYTADLHEFIYQNFTRKNEIAQLATACFIPGIPTSHISSFKI